jgi:hypothetical protein
MHAMLTIESGELVEVALRVTPVLALMGVCVCVGGSRWMACPPTRFAAPPSPPPQHTHTLILCPAPPCYPALHPPGLHPNPNPGPHPRGSTGSSTCCPTRLPGAVAA